MARKSDRRRPLTNGLLALSLSITCLVPTAGRVMAGETDRAIYFVAGTITANGYTQTYPVRLYRVGEQHKLALVRQIHSSEQGLIDFADDLHGRIYFVGSVASSGARLTILHENDPEREDFVPLPQFDDWCWGAIAGDQVAAGAQYCYQDRVVMILGDAQSGEPRVGPGSWAGFKSLQCSGVTGGPFQIDCPGFRILGGNLVLPGNLQPPGVAISRLAPRLDTKSLEGHTGGVLASTDRFFIFMVTPKEFQNMQGIYADNPPHAPGPVHVYVHDKVAGKWWTLDLPVTLTALISPPVRMFEPWLVTTVTEWRQGADENPGHDKERQWPNAQFPSVKGGYAHAFINLFLPGKLILDNLLDGRRITLETGQEDSEVLAIESDGRILYRANDSIHSAKIDGTEIKEPTLIVKDTDVPEIHWAFWGPPAMRERPSEHSRNSN